MIRIVAGSVGGRRLETPRGAATRPSSDRVREALFSRVESLLGGLDGARVLDLYAGSGAVGLEALSRGAGRAVLVEADRRVAAVARRNVDALGVGDRARVVTGRAERVVAGPAALAADLVFADPPYPLATDQLRRALGGAIAGGWCAPYALLVVERSSRSRDWPFPAAVWDVGSRRYGETTLWYGRRTTAPAPGRE